MGPFLGDVLPGAVVRQMWDSFTAAGASVTRSTNGTISVYKDSGTTQTTTGVTDTEDFDSLTGIHLVAIDTSSDATFYTIGSSYTVVLSGATIDGVASINAVLFSFSILRDAAKYGIIDAGLVQAYTDSTHVRLRSALSIGADDLVIGSTVFFYAGTGANQARPMSDWVNSTDTAVFDDALTTPVDATTRYIVFATAPNAALTSALTTINTNLAPTFASAGVFTQAALANAPSADPEVTDTGTASGGSETTCQSTLFNGATATDWIERSIQFTSGDGDGHTAYIQSINTGTTPPTITFQPAIPAAGVVSNGDTFKILRAARVRLAGISHTATLIGGIAGSIQTFDALNAGVLQVDVVRVNGVEVGGSGTDGDPWGPA